MRELVLARDDLLVDLHRILRVERRVSRVHLVHQHAEAPPVDRLAVTLGQYHFRRQVLRCTAQRPRAGVHHLAEAEVGHPNVAGILDHDILRLQVAIYQAAMVQILQGQCHLGGVELRQSLVESPHPPKVREHLAAMDERHHHVQVGIVL